MTRRTHAWAATAAALALPLGLLAVPAANAATSTDGATSSTSASTAVQGALLASLVPTSTDVSAATIAANQRIRTMLELRDANPDLRRTFAGRVVDLQTGSAVYNHYAYSALKPASTMKAITAALALRLYGADHRFPTWVLAGPTSDSVVVKAGGDPMLSRSFLRILAARTATALADAVPAGDTSATYRRTVYVDDSLFGDPTRPPGWNSTEWNKVRAFLLDRQRTSDSTADVGVYFRSRLALELQSRLGPRGKTVTVSFGGRHRALTGAKVWGAVSGHTLGAAIRFMLLWSDSNIAEMLFRHNAIATGHAATRLGGVAGVQDQFRSLGISLTNVRIVDGSGYSPDNRMTAYAETAVLQRAQRATEPRMHVLKDLLMRVGVDGTLSTSFNRFTTSWSRCAIGDAWAKSGTIYGVITIVGYARGSDGKLKVFSFLVNGTSSSTRTRHALDMLVATTVGCV